MSKILSFPEINNLNIMLKKQHKTIVLAGGCFDILHIGHVKFIEEAKKHGDILILFLESDTTITKRKGPNRPINAQQDRAMLLSAMEAVDYVILLEPDMTNKAYDDLVIALKPAIIATTKGDANRSHKERQAVLINGQVVDVTNQITDQSTTRLVELLHTDL